MLRQLPPAMLDDDFFVRFLSIFQTQANTLLAHAENLRHLADPGLAPPEMARWLGTWIGMDGVDAALPERLQRDLVRNAAQSLPWRGTRRGLVSLLEVLSGGPVEVRDGGGVFPEGGAGDDPGWVAMRVTTTGMLEEADFAARVAEELPAHVRAELWVGDRQVPLAGRTPGDEQATAITAPVGEGA